MNSGTVHHANTENVAIINQVTVNCGAIFHRKFINMGKTISFGIIFSEVIDHIPFDMAAVHNGNFIELAIIDDRLLYDGTINHDLIDFTIVDNIAGHRGAVSQRDRPINKTLISNIAGHRGAVS